MRELVSLIGNIIKNNKEQDIIDGFKLCEGVYIKIPENRDLELSDVMILNKDNKDIINEEYIWFRDRRFYDGMMFNDANKCISNIKKRMYGVNAYGLIFTYDNYKKTDGLNFDEVLLGYFNQMANINENINIDVNSEVDLYKKILCQIEANTELKSLLEKNSALKIHLYKETSSIDDFKKSYFNYINARFFNNNSTTVVDDKIYGTHSFQYALNPKKPTLHPKNGIRVYPYVIDNFEAMCMVYLSKLSYRDINTLIEKETGLNYEINWSSGVLTNFNQVLDEFDKKYLFTKKSFIYEYREEIVSWDNDYVLYLLDDKQLYNGVIKEVIKNSLTESKDVSDILKSSIKKINNSNIIQNIISNRKSLILFKKGKNISPNIFKKICMDILKYRLLLIKNITDLKEFSFGFEKVINILSYLKIGGFEDMANIATSMIKSFKEQLKNKSIEINNDKEFYFLAGQVIAYLTTLSESSNLNAGMLGSYNLKNIGQIKKHIIRLYNDYSHKLKLGHLWINIAYQAILLYEPTSKFNDELWFYFHAGLIGNNVFRSKVNKDITESENLEVSENE